MSQPTPPLRRFAKQLLALETTGLPPTEVKSSAGFRVCEKLRPHLARLMGNGGFRVLLSRAIALAIAEVRWLRAVHVKADGSLEGLAELQTQVNVDEFSEGGVELVAQLLGLLIAFIGENLTLRLVCEVWPGLSLTDLGFGQGVENEKTK